MNNELDEIERSVLEEKLKSTRFCKCFDCAHFSKSDYSCDGKRLWTLKMFEDDWYQMTAFHHPIGCKQMEILFKSSIKRRDFDVCRNCGHFSIRHDGGCFCWNSFELRCGRRRWCQETNEEVSRQLFEKATFKAWEPSECFYENGGNILCFN